MLLVAVPLQGFAATSMLTCGPKHHPLVATFALDVEPAGSAWHDHDNGVAHQHAIEQALDSGPPHFSVSSDEFAGSQTTLLNANFNCENCAPCCAGAMLTSEASVPIVVPANGADFPANIPTYPFLPVGGLDRPPRIILA
ncbi:MAG: hypothetical protein ACMG6H_01355 [Acidobacteriota bacterium]